ncbi:hypothetical protein [Mycobacterium sp. 1274761.0]|uniref:hypothetical protein n=1 Tax=Mycobacterium sp. 1274761.0 TaxID=1834077 RepID=UPI0007FC3C78|nr:hypothetical protein [Mycobacterium sp. 1274761.0]OBK78232.1 hypothetical protein A5651_03225 [Mycobacterium sp. 1274761.0]
MTVVALPRPPVSPHLEGALVSWGDPETECTVAIARPADDDSLWQAYLDGAERSYRGHGIGAAFDGDAVRRSGDTTLFWTMLDVRGKVIGGIRAIGPLTSPEDTHAVVEWEGQPAQPMVRKMIADRLPFGVVEMKSAWVTDDPGRSRRLTALLARSGCHMLAVLGIQFCVATCAHHVLARWRSSGGVVAPIPATPYPDERHRTKMMWWDRHTVASVAAPNQTAKIVTEMADIRRRRHDTSRHATVGS